MNGRINNGTTKARCGGLFLSTYNRVGLGLDPNCGDCALSGNRSAVSYTFESIKGNTVCLCSAHAVDRGLVEL